MILTSPEYRVQHNKDTSLQVVSLLQCDLSFLKRSEHCSFDGLLELGDIKHLDKLTLIDDLPHNILLQDILDVISQASFNILATHRDDLTLGLGNHSVRSDGRLLQDLILPKTIHGLQLLLLLLDHHHTLLDHIKRITIISLIEYHLSLLICLRVTSRSYRVLLILSQILKERKSVQKLLILFFIQLVDVIHNLLKNP